jgi:hypothetical protein
MVKNLNLKSTHHSQDFMIKRNNLTASVPLSPRIQHLVLSLLIFILLFILTCVAGVWTVRRGGKKGWTLLPSSSPGVGSL